MNDNSIVNKLNELKKIIRDTSADCGTDMLTEYILLTAIAEISLRKDGALNMSELEMKIEEAILKLGMQL